MCVSVPVALDLQTYLLSNELELIFTDGSLVAACETGFSKPRQHSAQTSAVRIRCTTLTFASHPHPDRRSLASQSIRE